MKREDDWDDPYMLEARPHHRATEAQQDEFIERVNQLGMIAAHIGADMTFSVSFKKPRKRKPKAAQP